MFERKRAIGVRFIRPGGYSYEVFANKEVILSAGAINSPHLLLLSGVGPKEELEKHKVSSFRGWSDCVIYEYPSPKSYN